MIEQEIKTKKCSGRCKKVLPYTTVFFSKRGLNENGTIRLTSDCKECRRVAHKSYRKRNPHKFNTNPELRKADQKKYAEQYRIYWREWRAKKYKEDIQFQLKTSLRGRMWHALKGAKKSKALLLLDCSIEEFKVHLERQFVDNMSWDNYGEWHIDHIKPCSKFNLTKIEEQQKCFHYTNMQPLWAVDNLQKGSKY